MSFLSVRLHYSTDSPEPILGDVPAVLLLVLTVGVVVVVLVVVHIFVIGVVVVVVVAARVEYQQPWQHGQEQKHEPDRE